MHADNKRPAGAGAGLSFEPKFRSVEKPDGTVKRIMTHSKTDEERAW